MPQAIAFVAPGLFGAGASFALVVAGGGLTTLGIGVSVASSLALSAATRPNSGGNAGVASAAALQPSVTLFNLRESVSARRRHYGEVRTGGAIVFFRADGGTLYRVVVHGQGQIDEITGYYIVNEQVMIDGSGYSTDSKYNVNSEQVLQILTRDGSAPSTAFSEITSVWPEYDASYKLDGLIASLTIARQVPAANALATYPDPQLTIQMQMRTSSVYDPRTSLTQYSDNAALVMADFITHPDGMGLTDVVDYVELIDDANAADELIALAAGGTDKRWRLDGTYSLNEQPTAVLQRMKAACGGDVRVTPQGKVRVRVGRWQDPTLTLEVGDVLEITRIDDGPSSFDRYSELPFTYVDPDLNFQLVTGDPWADEDLAADYGGVKTGDLREIAFAPSHSQGRRAAKITTSKENPAKVVDMRLQPWALPAIYEDVVTLDMPTVGLSGPYWVKRYGIGMKDGSITMRLEKADAAAFSWSASQEGIAQTLPVAADGGVLPTPKGFVAAGHGSSGAGIAAAWVAASSDLFLPRLEYSVAGAESWTVLNLTAGDTWEQIAGLSGDYDFRLAFVNGDIVGPYVTSLNVTASSDVSAPDSPSGFEVTDEGGGVAQIAFTTAPAFNLWKTEIRRDGVLVATLFNGPSEAVVFLDGPGAGNYTYSARSVNVGQTANAADVSAPITVS